MTKKYVGWGFRGKVFNEKQFKNSYVKENKLFSSYEDYLSTVAKHQKSSKYRDSLKRIMR